MRYQNQTPRSSRRDRKRHWYFLDAARLRHGHTYRLRVRELGTGRWLYFKANWSSRGFSQSGPPGEDAITLEVHTMIDPCMWDCRHIFARKRRRLARYTYGPNGCFI